MEENQAVKGLEDFSPKEKQQLLAPLLPKQEQKPKNAPLPFGQACLWLLHQIDAAHCVLLRQALHQPVPAAVFG